MDFWKCIRPGPWLLDLSNFAAAIKTKKEKKKKRKQKPFKVSYAENSEIKKQMSYPKSLGKGGKRKTATGALNRH